MSDEESARAPRPQVRLDARSLRGIAHPVRVRMLGILRAEGPGTSSTLAPRLGLNTGATSYHLRQLAAHGFIVEDPTRGTARERWWRAAHVSTTWERETLASDESGLGTVFLRSVAEVYVDQILRAVDELPTLSEAWREAGMFSDYLLVLTPVELRELTSQVGEVVGRYRSVDPEAATDEGPEDAVPVIVQFQTFPALGTPDPASQQDHAGSPED